MWNYVELENDKTYATRENAVKAVLKKFPDIEDTELRFFIYTNPEGRFFPVFIGQEALTAGMHFHFNVLA